MYMGNVQIKCAKRNCYWTGPIEDYEAHLKECVAVKLECVTHNSKQGVLCTEAVWARNTTHNTYKQGVL